MIFSRKSQVASMDIIIAVMVFMMLAAFIFSYMFSRLAGDTLAHLDEESDVLIRRLTSSDSIDPSQIKVATAVNLNEVALEQFISNMLSASTFYENVKARLNLRNEFCVHLETDDGKLLYLHQLIDNENLSTVLYDDNATFPDSILVPGLGSEKISINGIPCKKGSSQ
jgi:hypothetical protein